MKEIINERNRVDLNDPTFQALLDKWSRMTAGNSHTEQRIEVAKFFDFDFFIKIFGAIGVIHKAEGSIPSSVNEYRYQTSKNMKLAIAQEHGDEIANAVWATM